MAASFLSNGMNPSVPDVIKIAHLTSYERLGVIIMAVAGTTSFFLVSLLLSTISFTAFIYWRRRLPNSSVPFASKQIAVFVTCLLFSDLIQSVSGILQVKWAAERRIYEGTACSIQAATLVMGDIGSTVWSCVIAAHTFSGIALGRHWSRKAVACTVVIGWAFVLILTGVGPLVLPSPSRGPFFSIAGTWCFISSEYALARLGIHYIPLFIAAAVIAVMYVLLFLVLLGIVDFARPDTDGQLLPVSKAVSHQRVAIAKRMLWYPAVYFTCILPISITRLVGLQEENVPESVWIFGMFFLFSLGAADSVVYALTRHIIRPSSITANPTMFNNPLPRRPGLNVFPAEHICHVELETMQSFSRSVGYTPADLPMENSGLKFMEGGRPYNIGKRSGEHDSLSETKGIRQ